MIFRKSLLGLLALTSLALSQSLVEDLEGKGFNFAVPGSAEFEAQTQPFNRRYTSNPAVITFPTETSHVADIVSAARTYGYKVAARSGGHSYTAHGLGVEDGTVVIDMGNFKTIEVDSTSNVASIGVGNRLGEIITQLNSAGRGLPHGTCAYVGWGGHSTMGGYGFTSRMWGLTIDTVEEAEVVLGNGTVVVASQGENSDLLWGIRGAGPYLGIVTNVKAATFSVPVSGTIFSYSWQLSIDDAASALSAYQNFALTADIPREIGLQGVLSRGEADGTVGFGLSGGWYGPLDDLDGILQPLLDGIGFAPRSSNRDSGDYLHSAQNLAGGSLDTSAPGGTDTFYAKSLVTPKDSPISTDAIRAFVSTLATEGFQTQLGWWFIQMDLFGDDNSAISTPAPDDTVFPHRDALFTIQFYGSSRDNVPPYPDEGFTFLDDAVGSITQNMPADWGQGAYAPYMDDRVGSQGGDLYYKSNYARLLALKNQYDPDSIFALPEGWQA
ncbi:hypothetical protein BKA70DRAFT_1337340 [Coprinopsis sp. MPI-PUGE-AT-0042]|nr:hypothetical protein BKA70DRAFT_1337340 [Coprinopsis sp. MPI-PUGE-AT-0042]